MEDRPVEPAPSSDHPVPSGSGIAPNMAGALAYFLGALTGVLFLLIDRDRPFVRFHAMQSIVLTVTWVALSIALTLVGMILGVLPIVGWLVSLLLSVALAVGGFILWLYLMFRAHGGDEWEVPVIGAYARRFAAQV